MNGPVQFLADKNHHAIDMCARARCGHPLMCSWVCTGCAQAYCKPCVEEMKVGVEERMLCGHCGIESFAYERQRMRTNITEAEFAEVVRARLNRDKAPCVECGKGLFSLRCDCYFSPHYCGKLCQKKHWAVHKKMCSRSPKRTMNAAFLAKLTSMSPRLLSIILPDFSLDD